MEKTLRSPVTPQVSNETGGMQTPNVAETGSRNWLGARGKVPDGERK
ncbi:hypothetical protein [Coleofasciculus sp. G2-EDA-02]